MKHLLAVVVIVFAWFLFQPCSWWIVFTICLGIEAHRFLTRFRAKKLSNSDLLALAKAHKPPKSWYEEPEIDLFESK